MKQLKYEDILGPPNFVGEIRIVKFAALKAPDRTIYVRASTWGTWYELFEYEVEELFREGKL